MPETGKILKSAKTGLHKIAENNVSFFGQNINTNAGASVSETADGGLLFARPQSGTVEVPSFEFPDYTTSYLSLIHI